MKRFILLLQVIAVIFMLTDCKKGYPGPYPAGSSDMLGTVTFSINTDFPASFIQSATGKGSSSGLTGSVCRLEQFGWGTDAELGAFDVYLTCCWNPADGSHSCTEGYLTDYKGNTLTIVCNDGDNGVVFTPDFPYDQTNIWLEFEFTGGTGRFEGASGRGTIQCEVKGDSNLIIHHWDASLTLLME